MTDQEKVAKLPRWARVLIDKLESDCSLYKKERDSIFEKRVTTVYRSYALDKQYLPQNSKISFVINGEPISIYFRENDTLEIQGTSELAVLPRASNMVHITIVER